MSGRGEVTELLSRLGEGDDRALDALLPIVYAELRAIASGLLRGERADHTLQPTALLHETYLKLVGTATPVTDRRHFLAIASRVMRQVLVEHARARGRLKRGGGRVRVTLTEALWQAAPDDVVDLIALDDALNRLAEADPRKARVVELIYFGGLSARETAEVLEVTPRTVERDWSYARTWLTRELTR